MTTTRTHDTARRMVGDWMADALCAQTDPEAFHPEKGQVQDTRAARAVCLNCPVREQCLEFALASGDEFGVYGGLTPHERRQEKRRRKLTEKRNNVHEKGVA